MGGERGEAMAPLATIVGAMALSRAVDDEAFSREMLREVRKKLGVWPQDEVSASRADQRKA
jgi:hypothetical protein